MKSPFQEKRIAHLLGCLCLLATPALAGEMHLFHSADGKPLTASFESLTADQITLKREDGKTFQIAADKLCAEDQVYISKLATQSADLAAKLNTAVGHDLVTALPFPQRTAADIAKALKLPPESTSKYGQSWRRYAALYKEKYTLLGAVPYSTALYSDEQGHATSLSIVYANKGDFGSEAGVAEEHFKGGTTSTTGSLTKAMEEDEKTVAAALTSTLGAGKSERFGEGKTRRTVTRWDWNGHAFLLSNETDEYVGLIILPIAIADAGGKSTAAKDEEIKKRLLTHLRKEPNGDVSISEIPMVDQGPKGYCVPATFERAMRTMGLDADMYLLAMVGETSAGGGTSVEQLLDNVKHQVMTKGRRVKDESIKVLAIREVKRYIDQGIPIMWRLCSMSSYNQVANANTLKRAKVTDWAAYTAEITTASAEFSKLPKPESKYHMCLIIGYNEATQELAVSDSWGASYECRWVPISVANWASNGGIFMILP